MGICISTKKHKKNIKKIKDSNGTIKTNLKEKINTTLDKVTNINDKTNITMDKTETEKGVKEHDPQKNKNINNIIITENNTINIEENNEHIINTSDNNSLFSIRDEFNSNTNRNIPYNPHSFDIVNNRNKTNDNHTLNDTINNGSQIDDNQDSPTYRAENVICIFCSQAFNSIGEYEHHFNLCSLNHRRLSNSVNVNFRPQSNLLALLGLNEIDEQKEYINWIYNKNTKIWENKGKVYVTKEEINHIDNMSIMEIKSEKIFYKKRIWLRKKIITYIIDNTKNNSPLVISRKNIFDESYNQFMTSTELNLHRNIQIYFIEEVAHDAGGVEREWYSTIFKEIFSEKKKFFYKIETKSEAKGTFFISNEINENYSEKKDKYYSFIGVLFAKALLDKILIPYKLNPIILKFFIFSNDNTANINSIFNLDDIKYYDLEIYNSLNHLLITNLDNNEDIFFVWNINGKEIELIDNGKNILVKNNNKQLFINKVIELICYKSIEIELNSLKEGFATLIPFNYIKIFNIEELSFVLSGQSIINLKDWKLNTVYKGDLKEKSQVIQFFWEVLSELNNEQLLLFYKFCTGSIGIPVDGFSSISGPRNKIMKFTIESIKKKDNNNEKCNKLITAQTCFNSIILPEYKTKEEMKKAIYIILENDTNYFGLE
jgi:hypothetical protein